MPVLVALIGQKYNMEEKRERNSAKEIGAFTLVELTISMAILAILAGMAIIHCISCL